jgi:hypothetical protein
MAVENQADRRRRGIFGIGIGAPTQERPRTRVLPERGKRSLIQGLARNLALRIALAGTALAGTGYAIYHETPAVHQAVDQQFLDRIKGEQVVVPTPPDVFDGKALSGIISEKNGVVLSKEEAKQLFPQPIVLDEETRTATIFNFLEPPPGETIRWTRTPALNKETGIMMYVWQGTLPAGTKIKVSPVTDEYVSNGAGYLQDWKGGKNPERGDEIWKFSYDPVKNITTVINIGSVTGWFVFPLEMQNLPTYASIDVLKKIPEGTTIATTTQSTQVDIIAGTFPGKTLDGSNVNQQIAYSTSFFSTSSLNGTGGKIVDVK